MPSISRGFRRRERGGDPTRLPPGQHLEAGFPVLSAGPTPRVSLAEWSFSITGELDGGRRGAAGDRALAHADARRRRLARPPRGGPLLLVAGGSGLVPLMCIERHRRLAAPEIASTLLLSARGPEDVLYAAELDGAALTYTRRTPDGWTGSHRRIDAAMLAEIAPPPDARPCCFDCGPTAFVEHVAQDLVDLGHHRALVKTERFGPSG